MESRFLVGQAIRCLPDPPGAALYFVAVPHDVRFLLTSSGWRFQHCLCSKMRGLRCSGCLDVSRSCSFSYFPPDVITGWGSIHTKIQRLWRYQQLRWLWRRRNPSVYNRKMWKGILWILGRRRMAWSSHSVLARCGGGRWSRDLLVGAGSNPFIPATVRSFLRHQCALCNRLCTKAPLRSIVCAVTRCAPRSWFGCFLHPPHPSHSLLWPVLPLFSWCFRWAVLWLFGI